MAVFPDITCFEIQSTVTDGVKWQEGSSGKDWGADAWAGQSKIGWKFSGPAVTMSEERRIREFHAANKASFYYFDQWKEHMGVACDETGAGSLGTFTIPGKNGSGFTVYVNGVEIDSEDYAIDPGGGARRRGSGDV